MKCANRNSHCMSNAIISGGICYAVLADIRGLSGIAEAGVNEVK